MESFRLDPERNLIVPAEKENAEKEPEAKTVEENIEEDDEKYEIKKSYEALAEKGDVENFLQEVDDSIRARAGELGIEGDEEIELFRQKVFDLAELNFKNLDSQEFAEYLDSMYATNGDLGFIKSTIDDTLDDIYKNHKGEITTDSRFLKVKAAIEFAGKHKKVLNLGVLAIYLSTFGSGVLKALSGDGAKIIMDSDGDREDSKNKIEDADILNYTGGMGGENVSQTLAAFETFEENGIFDPKDNNSIGIITARQLMGHPELSLLIDDARDMNSPIDVLRQIDDAGEFIDGDLKFSLSIEEGAVHIKNISADNISAIEADLNKNDMSIMDLKGGNSYSLNFFLQNEDNIIKAIADNTGVSEKKLESYVDRVLLPDTSKIDVVKFKGFQVSADKDVPEIARLKNVKEEIYKNHGLNAFGQLIIDESLQGQIDNIITNDEGLVDLKTQEARDSFIKAEQGHRRMDAEGDLDDWINSDEELKTWVENNGELQEQMKKDYYVGSGLDYYAIIKADHKLNNSKLKQTISELGTKEVSAYDYKNSQDFQDMFLKDLEKEGYNLSDLDAAAKKDPKKVVEIVAKVVFNNVKYDMVEAKNINAKTIDSLDYVKVKHESIPAATLGTHAGVCHDYVITVAAGLDLLKKMGISNMDNYAVLATTFQNKHMYLLLATQDNQDNKIKIALLDPANAGADSDEDKFDVNELDAQYVFASYHGISEEVYKEYKGKLKDEKREDVLREGEAIESMHKKALQKIERYNSFVLQKEIIDMITTYNPRAIKRIQEESIENLF